MGRNMGMGLLSSTNAIFKRKFRWTFQVDDICSGSKNYSIPESFVKTASRPNLTIEETEINFLNGKMWIPGKGSWETVTITYYDLSDGGGGDVTSGMQALYSWIATVYDFTKGEDVLWQASNRREYAGVATLTMFDGCGNPLEAWFLRHAWPQAVNFGELDYSSSEECTIELTLRYSHAEYNNICGLNPDPCCSGCESGGSGAYAGNSAGTFNGFGNAQS